MAKEHRGEGKPLFLVRARHPPDPTPRPKCSPCTCRAAAIGASERENVIFAVVFFFRLHRLRRLQTRSDCRFQLVPQSMPSETPCDRGLVHRHCLWNCATYTRVQFLLLFHFLIFPHFFVNTNTHARPSQVVCHQRVSQARVGSLHARWCVCILTLLFA